MLSYQHAYHAGNHADILKHFVLTYTLQSLNKKDKPYTFFDTHAGSGLYDLLDNRSIKTGEAQKGIISLLEKENLPSELTPYLEIVKKYTSTNKYPGSPEIEYSLKRSQDVLILSELHPQEIQNLRHNFKGRENVQIHNRNGFEMLKALTPPATKRGAVLIDPSYEEAADYSDVAQTIIAVNKKWSNGIIMLWYPLLAHREVEINSMINSIESAVYQNNQNTEIANITYCVDSKDSHKEVELSELTDNNPPRLYGSGMLVINAPWNLEETAKKIFM